MLLHSLRHFHVDPLAIGELSMEECSIDIDGCELLGELELQPIQRDEAIEPGLDYGWKCIQHGTHER